MSFKGQVRIPVAGQAMCFACARFCNVLLQGRLNTILLECSLTPCRKRDLHFRSAFSDVTVALEPQISSSSSNKPML